MKILYITRKYPPSIGGMQTQSYQFYKNLSKKCDALLIGWGRSQIFLQLFMPLALTRAIIKLVDEKIDIIQLGDLVLSPMGFLIKLLFDKPVLTLSHGRDSAYKSLLYNLFVIGSAKRLDKVICVSNNMKQRLSARGLPIEKLKVIPNGISVNNFNIQTQDKGHLLSRIETSYGINLKNKKIIFSLSRLVAKKGIKEFIEDVFITIAKYIEDSVFLIAGYGPEKIRIARTISRLGLKNKIYLLGPIIHNSYIYQALFKVADVFVMPNIKTQNDAEGFGVVALEAALMDVPVVAYNVDGIGEAIRHQENGILIEEGEKDLFASSVISLLKDNTLHKQYTHRAKRYVIDNFNWDKIINAYIREYSQVLNLKG